MSPDDRERATREQRERDHYDPDKVQEELKRRLSELEKRTHAEHGRPPKEFEERQIERGMMLEGWQLPVPERVPEHRRFEPSFDPPIPGASQRARLRRDAPGRADPQKANRAFQDELARRHLEGGDVTRADAEEAYTGLVQKGWQVPKTVRERVFAPAELTREFNAPASKEKETKTPDTPERRRDRTPEDRER